MKCLPILGDLSDVSNTKALTKMADAGVIFRGAKANKTMAAAVLQFRSSVNSEAMFKSLCAAASAPSLCATAGLSEPPPAESLEWGYVWNDKKALCWDHDVWELLEQEGAHLFPEEEGNVKTKKWPLRLRGAQD